jgi:hypothetical protein
MPAGRGMGPGTSPAALGLMVFGLLFGVVLLQAEVGAFAKVARTRTDISYRGLRG